MRRDFRLAMLLCEPSPPHIGFGYQSQITNRKSRRPEPKAKAMERWAQSTRFAYLYDALSIQYIGDSREGVGMTDDMTYIERLSMCDAMTPPSNVCFDYLSTHQRDDDDNR